MSLRFSDFRIDEEGRTLWLGDQPLTLQPLVFDLIAYLARNAGRVVPKEELLDALWPGVHVTEGSLQRAVSHARAALRRGGMEDAIRNFARIGYRFGPDRTGLGALADAPGAEPPRTELPAQPCGLHACREAMSQRRWEEAHGLYLAADAAAPLSPADLDLWALALECAGRPSEAIAPLTRAVGAHAAAGNAAAAGRSAVVLSKIHLERGEMAIANGWIARAESLIRPEDQREFGLLLWAKSRMASNVGDIEGGLAMAEEVCRIGRAIGDPETEALGLIFRGFHKLCLGRTAEGLADQDHAAAIALSAPIDPVTGTGIYCVILWSCRTFGDWARANQWTLGYQQWCTAGMAGYSGACQLHRAEVLGVQGTLADALAHVHAALDCLPRDAPWAVGDAHRVLGDIHAAIGDDDAALAAYARVHALGWDREPGHAMLLLEHGDGDAAFSAIEAALAGRSWWTLQRQGLLLAHLAVVAAASGRPDRAREVIHSLTGAPDRWPMPSIRALTAEASATLLVAEGAVHDAVRQLHLARQLWTSIDSAFHAARIRLRLAELLGVLGDSAGAAAEVSAACICAERIGSLRLVDRCRALRPRDEITVAALPAIPSNAAHGQSSGSARSATRIS